MQNYLVRYLALMKNFKMILKSLISNNTCIDGGRGKKWYYAIIMFFLAIVIALVPTFVKQIKTQGSDMFANGSYGAQEASMAFSEELNKETTTYSLKIIPDNDGEKPTNKLVLEGEFDKFEYKDGDTLLFTFYYYGGGELTEDIAKSYNGDGTTSYALFTQHEFFIYLVNSNTKTAISSLGCSNAYKYFEIDPEKGYLDLKETLATGETVTEAIQNTWQNWKDFYKKAYNANRLRQLWLQCLIIAGIDIVITLLMGFMIWILTRGKKNPYRCFTLWETQKIAYWCSVTPAILTIALGFLLKNFANVLFPLLLGVRVMWLSMKSLRPDGTGYAAN